MWVHLFCVIGGNKNQNPALKVQYRPLLNSLIRGTTKFRTESLVSATIKFPHSRVHVNACAKFHAYILFKLLEFKKFISISVY